MYILTNNSSEVIYLNGLAVTNKQPVEVAVLTNAILSAYADGIIGISPEPMPGEGIPEAPEDGKLYGRKDGVWEEVVGGSGVPEAPEDGKQYARKDAGWSEVTGGPGDTYTNVTPVPTTIGGISSGTTFANKTMQEMWDSLLYPYQTPAFSSFGFDQSSPIEVGTTLSGNKTFTWATSNSGNITADSITIRDQTDSSDLAIGLSNDGTETLDIGSVQKTSATSHTWRISAVNTKSATFTRDVSIAWQWRRYFGESAEGTLDETMVKALRVSGLTSGFAGDYSFNAGGYKYVAYAAVLGTATTFKDKGTNLDIPFEAPETVSVTNAQGQTTNYRVHRSTNIMGGAVTIAVS